MFFYFYYPWTKPSLDKTKRLEYNEEYEKDLDVLFRSLV